MERVHGVFDLTQRRTRTFDDKYGYTFQTPTYNNYNAAYAYGSYPAAAETTQEATGEYDASQYNYDPEAYAQYYAQYYAAQGYTYDPNAVVDPNAAYDAQAVPPSTE